MQHFIKLYWEKIMRFFSKKIEIPNSHFEPVFLYLVSDNINELD